MATAGLYFPEMNNFFIPPKKLPSITSKPPPKVPEVPPVAVLPARLSHLKFIICRGCFRIVHLRWSNPCPQNDSGCGTPWPCQAIFERRYMFQSVIFGVGCIFCHSFFVFFVTKFPCKKSTLKWLTFCKTWTRFWGDISLSSFFVSWLVNQSLCHDWPTDHEIKVYL